MKRVAYHDIIISITMSNPPISVLSTHLIDAFIMIDLHNQEKRHFIQYTVVYYEIEPFLMCNLHCSLADVP